MKIFRKRLSRIFNRVKIYAHYFTRISLKGSSKNKKIIICFDGLLPHGGFVDRLKGIVSFYEVSKILGHEFYIQFDDPFHLNLFLKPRKIDWNIDRKKVNWEPFKTKFLYLVNDFKSNPLDIIKHSKAKTFIVYANIDYLKKICPEFTETILEDKWRVNFNELFQKTDYLSHKLNLVEHEKYISIHTRFTSLMGDFVDTTNKVLLEGEKKELLGRLQLKVKEIIQHTRYKCYAMSDSINFLNFINENEPVYLVEGEPFHMDKFDGKSTLEKHLKTILDFFVIANSEAVYFLRINPMYHSSFSKYASIVGNKPFNLVVA